MEHYNYFKNYYQQNSQFFEPLTGLAKGNMSEKLYDTFKSYMPKTLPLTKENEFRAYNFALIDLGLYLDLHPDDQNARNLFSEYKRKLKQATEEVETQVGPLTLNNVDSEYGWNWMNKWAWGEKNV